MAISRSGSSRIRRLLVMPLLIIVAAVVIGRYSTWQKAQQLKDVQQAVERLCADASAGADVASQLRSTSNPVLADQIAVELKDVCDPAKRAVSLSVAVAAGDHPQFGNGSATHTAMIRAGDRDLLGLRVRHTGGSGAAAVEFLGYWRP